MMLPPFVKASKTSLRVEWPPLEMFTSITSNCWVLTIVQFFFQMIELKVKHARKSTRKCYAASLRYDYTI